jgi:arsenate reductase (thioredoxin)
MRVLILCTANSARSQMAEGLLRHLAPHIEVHSAGAKPSTVNPFAIEAMHQRGINISEHRSKHLSEFIGTQFEYVITVCDTAAENCPVFPGKATRIHHGFTDPAAQTGSDADQLAAFVRVRDELEAWLREWVKSL